MAGLIASSTPALVNTSSDPLLPNTINVDGGCGCTLTRATVKGMTPATFEQLAMVETDLARVIANAAEAKVLGVQERGLTTLLRSSVRDIKPALSTQKVSEQSIILPYIQRRQRSYMNSNYWVIEQRGIQGGTDFVSASNWTGTAAVDTGKNPAGAADNRYITVRVSSAEWGADVNSVKNTFRGGPTSPDRYFLPGSSLIVYALVESGGTNKNKVIVYEVADAFLDTNDANKAWLLLKLPYSNLDGATGDPGISVGSGLAQIGANNVSDWEDWCNNQPADFNQRIIVNWLQTSRESRCVDQVYKDTLARVLGGDVNPYAANFKYMPLAEQNKIAASHSENAWLRSTFYGQAINENQTIEGYQSLPQVHDPEASTGGFGGYPGGQPNTDDGCILEYKANAVGIYTQLKEAARVADLAGGNLSLDDLFQHIYYLKRYRETDGDNIDTIDIMTDRYTADNLLVAFSRYYKAKYGASLTRFVDQGKKLEFNNQVLFNYNVYDIPEIAVQIAVFHDPFFDDLLGAAGQVSSVDIPGSDHTNAAAAKAANQAGRRALYMLDWSDINVGIAGTNSVTRKHPNVDAQEMYKCRMEANVKEYQLKSTRWTTMLDRPQRHLIVENFSDKLPTTSALATGDVIATDGTLVALSNTGVL